MIGGLFVLAFVTLPIVGLGPLLSRRFDWMPMGSRVAAASAMGGVVLTAEMLILTVARVPWTLGLLLAVPIVAVVAAYRLRGSETRRSTACAPLPAAARLLLVVPILAIGLVAFSAMTARVTSTDLLIHWGIKGEHFGMVREIDAGYLRDSAHFFLHSDYPPMWPCLYAYGTLLAGRLVWGATLATLPIFLGLSVTVVWSLGRLKRGPVDAAVFAAVYASMFGFLLCDAMTAGNADAALLFFETLALGLLVCVPEKRGAFILAGLALAGASWLKVEGVAFSGAVVVAHLLSTRPRSVRRFAQLAIPPLSAFLAWMVFCRANGIVDIVSLPRTLVLEADRFRAIAAGMTSAARMNSMYLPWMVAALPLVLQKPSRRTVPALIVAVLVAAFDCGIYLTSSGDPASWITWSGERTLLTPLLALFVAGMGSEFDDRAQSAAATRS